MQRAIAEPDRRGEKQVEYNTANNITPESIKRSIHDIMNSVYERDHVLVEIGDGGMADDVISIGHNFEAVLAGLGTRGRQAGADLNFEEASKLVDEGQQLRAAELAGGADPTAQNPGVEEVGIGPWHEDKRDRGGDGRGKPTRDEMGPGPESKIYQPRSMPESMPNARPPRSPAKRGGAASSPGSGSKIIQPTNSR